MAFLLLSHSSSSSPLSPAFYSLSCPNVALLIRDSIRSAAASDESLPGKLLRLLFHDCIVEGCDASVLVAGNGTERSDPANRSLGGFAAVEAAKRLVELFCAGVVSCADVLVLAAREAVVLVGEVVKRKKTERGPSVEVPLGRRDGRISSASNVRPNMVDTSFSLNDMDKIFSSKGLNMDDLVALSGVKPKNKTELVVFEEEKGRTDEKRDREEEEKPKLHTKRGEFDFGHICVLGKEFADGAVGASGKARAHDGVVQLQRRACGVHQGGMDTAVQAGANSPAGFLLRLGLYHRCGRRLPVASESCFPSLGDPSSVLWVDDLLSCPSSELSASGRRVAVAAVRNFGATGEVRVAEGADLLCYSAARRSPLGVGLRLPTELLVLDSSPPPPSFTTSGESFASSPRGSRWT
ncbi:Peroxidase 18 [Apostasia shenzhenica]|uniref:Peroxidase n=1 Tax=Apostasia shenzhenica TaxID=1088818 RepID=A0A2I0BCF6_9ASPA|nr:Peroxidase 18 [Apostasia shenzhenica]